MASKTGEQLSEKTFELLKMEEEYAVGACGSLPGFMVSGKGSTLLVSAVRHPIINGKN